MLVLSRKESEETVIVIPPSQHTRIIRHRQLDRRGDGTRMAWILPPSVEVYREEIYPGNLAEIEAGKEK